MEKPPSDDSSLDAAKEYTRDYAKRLWGIVQKYRQTGAAKPKVSNQPKRLPQDQTSGRLLQLLSFIPYILASVFILSFFWDFNQLQTVVFGYVLHFQGLLRILSVSGLIGFLTNWVAITMLFKPAQKRPILGQGLIPAQKDRIASRLAQAVSDDLINPEIIKQKIHQSNLISKYRRRTTRYVRQIIDDPGFRGELKQWMVQYLEEMIGDADIRAAIAQKIIIQIEESIRKNALERVALRAYSVIRGQKMQQLIEQSLKRIPESVESGLERFDDLLDELPDRIEENSERIEQWITDSLYKLVNQLDVQNLVEENLRQYDEQHLSDVILNATNEQLRYIQYLGGILGVVGGFIIWQPVLSLAFFTVIVILLFLLDNIIFKFNQN